MSENLGDILRRRAWISPNNQAMVDLASGECLTYPDLNARVNQTAHMLSSLGLKAGDHIALLAFNSNEFVEIFFAGAKLGLVVVPLNWRLTPHELSYILNNSESNALFFGAEFSEAVATLYDKRAELSLLKHFVVIGREGAPDWALEYAELRDKAPSDEPALGASGSDALTIVYTSGTTGLPKGVVHSHQTAISGLNNALATFPMAEHENYLIALPLFHVGASTPLLLHLMAGNTVFLMRQFDPVAMWDVIEAEHITTTLAVPAMLNFMLKVPDFQSRDISSLTGILSGASPVPLELIKMYHDLGIQIHQVYGMTETFGPGCFLHGSEAIERNGAAGKGYMMTDIRLVDDAGNEVPAGVPGEILMRGGHNMVGYWKNPEATAETMHDGWLRSGDIGIADEDGYVTVNDRLKDMIISGGENVYPAEVENVLLAHPDVADAAVIGQSSEKWGETPLAVVVCASKQRDKEAILAHCNECLAGFKAPKDVVFVAEIPRNPTGKPLKRLLRDQFPGPAPV